MGGYCGSDVVQLHCSFQATLHHSSSCVSAYQCSTMYCYNLPIPLQQYQYSHFSGYISNAEGSLSPNILSEYAFTLAKRAGEIIGGADSSLVQYNIRSSFGMHFRPFKLWTYHVLLAALSGVVIPDQEVKPSEAFSGWPCCSARGAPRTVASHQRYDTVKSWVIIHYFHIS